MTEQSFSLAAILAALAVFPLSLLFTRRVRRPKPAEPPVGGGS